MNETSEHLHSTKLALNENQIDLFLQYHNMIYMVLTAIFHPKCIYTHDLRSINYLEVRHNKWKRAVYKSTS